MIIIDNKAVKVKSSLKILGVQIDAELNFNFYVANISRSVANELNTLIKLAQSAFTFSKLTMETLEQGVKYVQC